MQDNEFKKPTAITEQEEEASRVFGDWNRLPLYMHGWYDRTDDFRTANRFLLSKLHIGDLKVLKKRIEEDEDTIPSQFFEIMRLFVWENDILKKELFESSVNAFKLYMRQLMLRMMKFDDPKADFSKVTPKAYIKHSLNPQELDLGLLPDLMINIVRVCHILVQNEKGATSEESNELFDQVVQEFMKVIGATIKIVEADLKARKPDNAAECLEFLKKLSPVIKREANSMLMSLASEWSQFSTFLKYGLEVQEDCFKKSIDVSIESLNHKVVLHTLTHFHSYSRMNFIYELISSSKLMAKLAPKAIENRELILKTILDDIETFAKTFNLRTSDQKSAAAHSNQFLLNSLENMFTTDHAEEDRTRVFKLFYEKLMGLAGPLLQERPVAPELKQVCLDFMASRLRSEYKQMPPSYIGVFFWTVHMLMPIFTCRISLEEFIQFRNSIQFEHFMLVFHNFFKFDQNEFKGIIEAADRVSSFSFIRDKPALVTAYFDLVSAFTASAIDERKFSGVSPAELINFKILERELIVIEHDLGYFDVARLALFLESDDPSLCINFDQQNPKVHEAFLARIASDDLKEFRQCLSMAIGGEIGVKSSINEQENLDVDLALPNSRTKSQSIIVEIDFESTSKYTVKAFNKTDMKGQSDFSMDFLKNPSGICKNSKFFIASCANQNKQRII